MTGKHLRPAPMKIKQVFDAITSCDGADANEGARVRSRPQAHRRKPPGGKPIMRRP